MIKSKKSHLKIEAASHPGMSGKQNEDRYRVTSYFVDPKERKPSVLVVLCDGIGGHKAGEIAAQMGVDMITEAIMAGDVKKPLETIGKAIRRASDAIYEASQSEQGRSGMGATCAVAWIIGVRLYAANLGDSRIYLLRDGHILQLTTDHTWVQEAYEAGIINQLERENHPNAHVIRRYLGAKNAPEPDFRMWYFEGESDSDALQNQGMPLKAGDILLLCSDGLTDLVTDNEINSVIGSEPLETAVSDLIRMANTRGGHDNITLVLLKAPSKGLFTKSRKAQLLKGCLITLMVISAMVTAFFFSWRWWQNKLDERVEEPTATTETMVFPTALSTGTPLPTINSMEEQVTPTQINTPQPTITPWPTNTP
jgi:protein phosphatase